MKHLRSFAVMAMLLIGLTACGSQAASGETSESVQVFAMDTIMNITAYGQRAGEALQTAAEKLTALDRELSRTNPDSAVSQMNEAAGEPVKVSSTVSGLLQAAQEYSVATGGALDITIAPIADAWGFTKEEKHVPKQETLDQLLGGVGMNHVRVEGESACVDVPAQIDLGAIAKGYASDLMEECLREYKITRGLVELGGNLFLLGGKENGSAWRAGIKDPNHIEQICGVLSLKDAYVITSGGYQRNFEENGVVYHHIIDPTTGYPAQSGLISVTVVAPANGSDYDGSRPGNGAMCDAFSTALFVMGEEKALNFWRNSGYDFELVLVTEDGRVVTMAGLTNCFAPVEGTDYTYEIAD